MIRTVDQLKRRIFKRWAVLDNGGRKRTEARYIAEPVTFDIETTNIDKYQQAVMYIWQCQISSRTTVIGRTWEEFRQLVDLAAGAVPDDALIVCYVHNLSFEFQFLKSVLPVDDLFALDNRKVLKFRSGKWEFRCSYLHSNMGLGKFLQAMNVKDKKLTMDYSVKRYPWTPLSPEDLAYCINDVKGLREALIKEMKKDGDDLYTIPLTSTGYVRREARQALAGYQKYIRPMLPDREIFDMLRAAFRGGNTHANRWNSMRIIKARTDLPINSFDISSSYPSVLMTEKYPCQFVPADPKHMKLLLEQDRALLMDISLFDVRLKDELWGCPYLAKAKALQIEGGVYDNGRILQAVAIRLVINEIDLSIIENEYTFTYQVNRLYSARKQPLPAKFQDLLLDMYRQKTALKGVDDYAYGKMKNKFNSFYGMCVQNPCKPELVFQDGMIEQDLSLDEDALIKEYRRKGWLPYQWGVWCTSYARLKLEAGLNAIPPERFIYADTDSIKFIGDYADRFRELNKAYQREELSALDRKGKRHYLGIFEQDNDLPIMEFITMGAKKYAYRDAAGIHLTVSGVSKRSGADELGSLDNFREGFIFRKAGGTESLYNDFPGMDCIRIQGHKLPITSNVMIKNSTYTLGITEEYRRLINYLSNADIKREVYFDYE